MTAVLWVYPTISAVQLATAEPMKITVLGCGKAPGNTDSKYGCSGEWTAPDGSTGHGYISDGGDYRARQVVDGYLIGGKGRISTTGWIIDMAVAYPLALLGTFFAYRSVRRWHRNRGQNLLTPLSTGRL
ncbi:hypothetical protein AB0I28_14365 [Phytomonospora sp. NPDC050363]|uniref:hypothetical protein n=1 Tax=Phytomonospora sp. NPDC050363 TaxID=3155642 RepID=UPI0033F90740